MILPRIATSLALLALLALAAAQEAAIGSRHEIDPIEVKYGHFWRNRGIFGEIWPFLEKYGHFWRNMGILGENAKETEFGRFCTVGRRDM